MCSWVVYHAPWLDDPLCLDRFVVNILPSTDWCKICQVYSKEIYSTVCKVECTGWDTTNAEHKVPSAQNPEPLKVLSLKAGVDQNIALHAFPTARDSFFLISDFRCFQLQFSLVIFRHKVPCLKLMWWPVSPWCNLHGWHWVTRVQSNNRNSNFKHTSWSTMSLCWWEQ